MIKSLSVQGLHGRIDFKLDFHEDINIITGKNGCGKTTVLKLIWYMISGNIERINSEMNIESALIVTDFFTLSFQREAQYGDDILLSWKYIDKIDSIEFPAPDIEREQTTIEQPRQRARIRGAAEYLSRRITTHPSGSVFFPTFRRIEGGFSMDRSSRNREEAYLVYGTTGKIEEAMSALSDRLSTPNHKFVASISTKDIVEMLTKQYASISQKINREHSRLSEGITELINNYYPTMIISQEKSLLQAEQTLNTIQTLVNDNTDRRQNLLMPFNSLGNLISQIFQYKGIRITTGITLGEQNDAISSDVLSAGEKQMLSFLAYNAFTTNSVVFIDEPEISLHVDWQRTLFPTLASQGTNNQFIVATHSPLIYSKYSDKELILDRDKGE